MGVHIPMGRDNFEWGRGSLCKVLGIPSMFGSDAAFCQITFDHLLLPDNNSQMAVYKAACGVMVIAYIQSCL